MDSFYEQPRKAPQRKILNASAENVVPNLIPEVSMLQQNKGNICQKRNEMSYNAWKHQLRSVSAGKVMSNKENLATPCPRLLYSTTHQNSHTNGSLFRKQVRFEPPNSTQSNSGAKAPNLNINPPRPALVNRQFIQQTNAMPDYHNIESFEPLSLPVPPKRHILPEKPLEKLYLANIPNRNLELSLIDPPRLGFKHILPQITPPMPHIPLQPLQLPPKYEIAKPQETKPNEDPTVKDLLKIIQQQNEQMLVLQQQVSSLMKERSQQPMLEASENLMKMPPRSPKTANKFAIDVMTSFEVSIRPPPERFKGCNLDFGQNCKDHDVSLKLEEPLVVHERCLSPTQSIHVDMHDYSSDDDDGDEDRSTNLNSSMIGWTIYNNVMEQVNYAITKSSQNPMTNDAFHAHEGAHLMQHVKDVTLKHLQNAGIHLNCNVDDLKINDSPFYSTTEVSFVVKQLLMKYLPDEKLTNIRTRQSRKAEKQLRHENYPRHAINRRPEFSMATMQYMEKYNMLKNTSVSNRKPAASRYRRSGMLDITGLKQQPKLL